MKVFSAALTAIRIERVGITFQQVTYTLAISIPAETPDEARGTGLQLARDKYLPLSEKFMAHQVAVSDVPHDVMMQYAQQFAMPIIKRAP